MKAIFYVVLLIISIIVIIWGVGMYKDSAEIVVVEVTGVDRVRSGDSDKYLVYTTTETFENTDSMLFGKHNSSDFQGKFSQGGKFQVKVVGWRSGWRSSYRNIVEIL